MISKFYKWLTKPMLNHSTTTPLTIIIIVSIMTVVRNIPLDENSFDMADIGFWVRRVATFLAVFWVMSKINNKNSAKGE